MDLNSDFPSSEQAQFGFNGADLESIVDLVCQVRQDWSRCDAPVDLGGGVRWRPHLRSVDGRLGFVHLSAGLREVWAKRIDAARRVGFEVEIFAPPLEWERGETLDFTDEVGAIPNVLNGGPDVGWKIEPHRSVSKLVATRQVRLVPETFRVIGRRCIQRARETPAKLGKGTLFEDFLCLFFSQITYFTVLGANVKNPTEEIDVYLENVKDGQWISVRSPFVVVTAKNEKEPMGVQVLTYLIGQMQMRRDTCKIGFLCSAGKIASTVYRHYEKQALRPEIIVILSGDDFDNLLDDAIGLDKNIRELVWRASTK